MNRTISLLLFVTLILAGCATPYQGIKMRVQSPPIDEAFRKASLAITVDGYEIESVSPSTFRLETKWREVKEGEMSKSDKTLGMKLLECRIALRMEARGKLFDVFCTPSLRYTLQDGTVRETIADATHPLREKWEDVFRRLLERESKEED
jgi:hypothetical protein